MGAIEQCEGRAPGMPGMGCFYGDSGYGKTTAGIVATNTYNAVHIEAIPVGGIKALLALIAAELGLKTKRVSAADLFVAIVMELGLQRRPLIIDEADLVMLSDRAADTIRLIHEKSGVPVILMGLEVLPRTLKRWEQLDGRLLCRVAAEPACLDDVHHLVRLYAPGIEVGADLKAAILAASKGSLRYIATNLASLRSLAAERGLTRVDRQDWGVRPFHSVDPPPMRQSAAPALPARHRGAA
jgi:DNA transposition AAA+ family ATPase